MKRAAKDTLGRWQLVSDHPARSPVDLPNDAVTIGQVKWAARPFD